MNNVYKKVFLIFILAVGIISTAAVLNNEVFTYVNPGLRFGGTPDANQLFSTISRVLSFSIFLGLILAIKSLKFGFIWLGLHIIWLVVSGYIFFWT
jgi:hypothetical protein